MNGNRLIRRIYNLWYTLFGTTFLAIIFSKLIIRSIPMEKNLIPQSLNDFVQSIIHMYIMYIMIFSLIIFALFSLNFTIYGLPSMKLLDPELTAIPIIQNLSFFPSNMDFLNDNEILVLDKNNGTVRMISNGILNPNPLLKVNVSPTGERGLLGIAIEENNTSTLPTQVFLYFTEAINSINLDTTSEYEVKNRLYKYDLVNNKLVNPRLLLELPAGPGTTHNGGAIRIGPDGNIYIPYGDLGLRTQTQNIIDGPPTHGTGGILRITQNGSIVEDGFSLGVGNLSLFFGYGIRNSFGIDFDPISGYLWDTENGPDYGDEVNLVKPGFNSGWLRVQGEWSPKWSSIPGFGAFIGDKVESTSNLVNFGNKGIYRSPEFMTGNFTIGPTAIQFLSSDTLGDKYQNDMFVGDIHNGNIYRFELNEKREGLIFNNQLADKIANTKDELKPLLFGEGFGSITDIEESEDGYLYILSAGRNAIFKIMSN